MIPREIAAEHVRAAIAQIDRDGVPPGREPTRYHLMYRGKRYPPKYVVTVAARYAIGREWPSGKFNGGSETNTFLRRRGFNIEDSVTHERVAISNLGRSRRSAPSRATEATDCTGVHRGHCQKCKDRVLSLLERLYGLVETQRRFSIGSTPAAFATSAYSPQIREIFVSLQRERGLADFVRAATVPPCDYFVPQPGMIVEFDESQHFSPLRQLTLSRYPCTLPLGFDREQWIDLCRRTRARDNDPADRDEQRAWYDTLRDFLPTVLNLRPTMRLYAEGFGAPGSPTPGCKLSANGTEHFRQILSEHAHFWTITVSGPQTARYGRVVIDGAWGGDQIAAGHLLRDVAHALRPNHRLRCLSTCGAFLRFKWPQHLQPRGNLNPDLKETGVLTGAAERTVRSVLSDGVLNALRECCDYLTLGVDTEKDTISTTSHFISKPHAELVTLVDLRNGKVHWTGKFYPTPQQQRTIVRFPDLESHFVPLDGDAAMILGCHDLTVYSPRGQARAGGWRQKVSEDFRKLAVRHRPTVVLHHPHTTVKRGTWKHQWHRLEHDLPFVEQYLGTGAYSYRDDGWHQRDDLERVLDSTQHGDILNVVVRPGAAA